MSAIHQKVKFGDLIYIEIEDKYRYSLSSQGFSLQKKSPIEVNRLSIHNNNLFLKDFENNLFVIFPPMPEKFINSKGVLDERVLSLIQKLEFAPNLMNEDESKKDINTIIQTYREAKREVYINNLELKDFKIGRSIKFGENFILIHMKSQMLVSTHDIDGDLEKNKIILNEEYSDDCVFQFYPFNKYDTGESDVYCNQNIYIRKSEKSIWANNPFLYYRDPQSEKKKTYEVMNNIANLVVNRPRALNRRKSEGFYNLKKYVLLFTDEYEKARPFQIKICSKYIDPSSVNLSFTNPFWIVCQSAQKYLIIKPGNKNEGNTSNANDGVISVSELTSPEESMTNLSPYSGSRDIITFAPIDADKSINNIYGLFNVEQVDNIAGGGKNLTNNNEESNNTNAHLNKNKNDLRMSPYIKFNNIIRFRHVATKKYLAFVKKDISASIVESLNLVGVGKVKTYGTLLLKDVPDEDCQWIFMQSYKIMDRKNYEKAKVEGMGQRKRQTIRRERDKEGNSMNNMNRDREQEDELRDDDQGNEKKAEHNGHNNHSATNDEDLYNVNGNTNNGEITNEDNIKDKELVKKKDILRIFHLKSEKFLSFEDVIGITEKESEDIKGYRNNKFEEEKDNSNNTYNIHNNTNPVSRKNSNDKMSEKEKNVISVDYSYKHNLTLNKLPLDNDLVKLCPSDESQSWEIHLILFFGETLNELICKVIKNDFRSLILKTDEEKEREVRERGEIDIEIIEENENFNEETETKTLGNNNVNVHHGNNQSNHPVSTGSGFPGFNFLKENRKNSLVAGNTGTKLVRPSFSEAIQRIKQMKQREINFKSGITANSKNDQNKNNSNNPTSNAFLNNPFNPNNPPAKSEDLRSMIRTWVDLRTCFETLRDFCLNKYTKRYEYSIPAGKPVYYRQVFLQEQGFLEMTLLFLSKAKVYLSAYTEFIKISEQNQLKLAQNLKDKEKEREREKKQSRDRRNSTRKMTSDTGSRMSNSLKRTNTIISAGGRIQGPGTSGANISKSHEESVTDLFKEINFTITKSFEFLSAICKSNTINKSYIFSQREKFWDYILTFKEAAQCLISIIKDDENYMSEIIHESIKSELKKSGKDLGFINNPNKEKRSLNLIDSVVDYLNDSNQYDLNSLSLLSKLMKSKNKGITSNQEHIFNSLVEDKKDKFLLKITPKHNDTIFYVVYRAENRDFEYRNLVDLCNIKNTLSDYDKKVVAYLASQLNMYADMCYGRNYLCIEKIRELFPLDHLIFHISNLELHEEILSGLINILNYAYIDIAPHSEIIYPSMIKIINQDLKIEKTDKYPIKTFIPLDKLNLILCISLFHLYNIKFGKFLVNSSNINLLFNLISFRLYENVEYDVSHDSMGVKENVNKIFGSIHNLKEDVKRFIMNREKNVTKGVNKYGGSNFGNFNKKNDKKKNNNNIQLEEEDEGYLSRNGSNYFKTSGVTNSDSFFDKIGYKFFEYSYDHEIGSEFIIYLLHYINDFFMEKIVIENIDTNMENKNIIAETFKAINKQDILTQNNMNYLMKILTQIKQILTFRSSNTGKKEIVLVADNNGNNSNINSNMNSYSSSNYSAQANKKLILPLIKQISNVLEFIFNVKVNDMVDNIIENLLSENKEIIGKVKKGFSNNTGNGISIWNEIKGGIGIGTVSNSAGNNLNKNGNGFNNTNLNGNAPSNALASYTPFNNGINQNGDKDKLLGENNQNNFSNNNNNTCTNMIHVKAFEICLEEFESRNNYNEVFLDNEHYLYQFLNQLKSDEKYSERYISNLVGGGNISEEKSNLNISNILSRGDISKISKLSLNEASKDRQNVLNQEYENEFLNSTIFKTLQELLIKMLEVNVDEPMMKILVRLFTRINSQRREIVDCLRNIHLVYRQKDLEKFSVCSQYITELSLLTEKTEIWMQIENISKDYKTEVFRPVLRNMNIETMIIHPGKKGRSGDTPEIFGNLFNFGFNNNQNNQNLITASSIDSNDPTSNQFEKVKNILNHLNKMFFKKFTLNTYKSSEKVELVQSILFSLQLDSVLFSLLREICQVYPANLPRIHSENARKSSKFKFREELDNLVKNIFKLLRSMIHGNKNFQERMQDHFLALKSHEFLYNLGYLKLLKEIFSVNSKFALENGHFIIDIIKEECTVENFREIFKKFRKYEKMCLNQQKRRGNNNKDKNTVNTANVNSNKITNKHKYSTAHDSTIKNGFNTVNGLNSANLVNSIKRNSLKSALKSSNKIPNNNINIDPINNALINGEISSANENNISSSSNNWGKNKLKIVTNIKKRAESASPAFKNTFNSSNVNALKSSNNNAYVESKFSPRNNKRNISDNKGKIISFNTPEKLNENIPNSNPHNNLAANLISNAFANINPSRSYSPKAKNKHTLLKKLTITNHFKTLREKFEGDLSRLTKILKLINKFIICIKEEKYLSPILKLYEEIMKSLSLNLTQEDKNANTKKYLQHFNRNNFNSNFVLNLNKMKTSISNKNLNLNNNLSNINSSSCDINFKKIFARKLKILTLLIKMGHNLIQVNDKLKGLVRKLIPTRILEDEILSIELDIDESKLSNVIIGEKSKENIKEDLLLSPSLIVKNSKDFYLFTIVKSFYKIKYYTCLLIHSTSQNLQKMKEPEKIKKFFSILEQDIDKYKSIRREILSHFNEKNNLSNLPSQRMKIGAHLLNIFKKNSYKYLFLGLTPILHCLSSLIRPEIFRNSAENQHFIDELREILKFFRFIFKDMLRETSSNRSDIFFKKIVNFIIKEKIVFRDLFSEFTLNAIDDNKGAHKIDKLVKSLISNKGNNNCNNIENVFGFSNGNNSNKTVEPENYFNNDKGNKFNNGSESKDKLKRARTSLIKNSKTIINANPLASSKNNKVDQESGSNKPVINLINANSNNIGIGDKTSKSKDKNNIESFLDKASFTNKDNNNILENINDKDYVFLTESFFSPEDELEVDYIMTFTQDFISNFENLNLTRDYLKKEIDILATNLKSKINFHHVVYYYINNNSSMLNYSIPQFHILNIFLKFIQENYLAGKYYKEIFFLISLFAQFVESEPQFLSEPPGNFYYNQKISEISEVCLRYCQNLFLNNGSVEVFLKIICEGNQKFNQTLYPAILNFFNRVLQRGNQDTQMKFFELFNSFNNSDNLFHYLKTIFNLDIYLFLRNDLEVRDFKSDLLYTNLMSNQLNFLQSLTENHFAKLQTFLREQTSNKVSYNFIFIIVDYMNMLLSKMNIIQEKNSLTKYITKLYYTRLIACFESLCEFLQGPCVINQENILNSKIIEIFDKILRETEYSEIRNKIVKTRDTSDMYERKKENEGDISFEMENSDEESENEENYNNNQGGSSSALNSNFNSVRKKNSQKLFHNLSDFEKSMMIYKIGLVLLSIIEGRRYKDEIIQKLMRDFDYKLLYEKLTELFIKIRSSNNHDVEFFNYTLQPTDPKDPLNKKIVVEAGFNLYVFLSSLNSFESNETEFKRLYTMLDKEFKFGETSNSLKENLQSNLTSMNLIAFRKAMLFYKQNCLRIEILKNDVVHTVYFPRLNFFKNMTEEMIKNIKENANRTSVQTKLISILAVKEDMYNSLKQLHQMEFVLNKFGPIRAAFKHPRVFLITSVTVGIIMNFLILLSYSTTVIVEDVSVKDIEKISLLGLSHDTSSQVLRFFGIVLIICSALTFAEFLTKKAPQMYRKTVTNHYRDIYDKKTKTMTDLEIRKFSHLINENVDCSDTFKKLKICAKLILNGEVLYASGYLAFAILAISYHYFFFCYHLIEFIKSQSVLRNVLKSVYNPRKQLIFIFMFFMVLEYFYSLIVFYFFYDQMPESSCSSMLICLATIYTQTFTVRKFFKKIIYF
jgi:hypothetical protein